MCLIDSIIIYEKKEIRLKRVQKKPTIAGFSDFLVTINRFFLQKELFHFINC